MNQKRAAFFESEHKTLLENLQNKMQIEELLSINDTVMQETEENKIISENEKNIENIKENSENMKENSENMKENSENMKENSENMKETSKHILENSKKQEPNKENFFAIRVQQPPGGFSTIGDLFTYTFEKPIEKEVKTMPRIGYNAELEKLEICTSLL